MRIMLSVRLPFPFSLFLPSPSLPSYRNCFSLCPNIANDFSLAAAYLPPDYFVFNGYLGSHRAMAAYGNAFMYHP